MVVATNRPAIPARLGELLLDKGLEWMEVSFAKLYNCVKGQRRIGALLVDTDAIEAAQIKRLESTVKYLRERGVPTLFINNSVGIDLERYPGAVLVEGTGEEKLAAAVADAIDSALEQTDRATELTLNAERSLADDTAEQLKMAGEVQKSFLPKRLPNSETVRWATLYQPADWVSGDIYDVARLDEQHIGFYIADAVGHSMPAALLTMFIKQAIVMRETKENTYRIFGPLDVMRNLNRRMCEQNLGQLFATCCYCLLNVRTLQLTYCRGGHCYPVLIRKDGTLGQLEARGSLIGIFEEAEFRQESVQLEHGDKVLIYSDGVEKAVGRCDDSSRFVFDENFISIAKYRIEHFMSEFGQLARHMKIVPAEVDDITAIGLEIL